MQSILKFLAGILGGAAVGLLYAFRDAFSSPAPADINAAVFAVVSAVGLLGVNYLLGKFGPK